MESTLFFNAKAQACDVTLFLDINPKNDVIKEFSYEGANAPRYKIELEELKLLAMGKPLSEAILIKRSQLQYVTEIRNNKEAISALGLTLLKSAITDYLSQERFYKEQHDMVCLCFSVTKKDIVEQVFSDKDFELKTLIQKTMASSACGSCRVSIEKIIVETRNQHGLIKGMDHSKSRLDANGKWIKFAGLYPGPLLIRLDELKKVWMTREGILDQYEIEFLDIEGLHLTVKINPSNEKSNAGLLSALSDYLKSELGILFFLHSTL